ncbi:MAG: hypothetical protein LC792_09500 [Actinobacteria bacterium]|nr:hypothetical protein [Actinomycetota bacterium]
MRPLLAVIAAAAALVGGLSHSSHAVAPESVSPAPTAHTIARIQVLACQVPMPNLPPKDRSKLPGCR